MVEHDTGSEKLMTAEPRDSLSRRGRVSAHTVAADSPSLQSLSWERDPVSGE